MVCSNSRAPKNIKTIKEITLIPFIPVCFEVAVATAAAVTTLKCSK